ncbi:hypothetical protein [Thalassotalea sp. PP2-459]|uniref:hypothetical protein n=1 Tax=Thalassotalea sp. PP2-459 TaxID=1742724 RepID=UPI0015881F5D|nr:hypothetical protein [Thalassotalea sp. PP2-459]
MEETKLSKKNDGRVERIVTKLSILAIVGSAIAAINHFVGYSFLKGKIEGLGLG